MAEYTIDFNRGNDSNAGTLIDGVVLKDFYGKDITSTPDIGAHQIYTARTAR